MTEDGGGGPLGHEEIVDLGALHLRTERSGDVHHIELRGELDIANAADVEQELKRVEATDASSIVVDLSGLTFLDSTGIRLALDAQSRTQHDAGRLVLMRAPDTVQRVFRIAGIEDRLPFAD